MSDSQHDARHSLVSTVVSQVLYFQLLFLVEFVADYKSVVELLGQKIPDAKSKAGLHVACDVVKCE